MSARINKGITGCVCVGLKSGGQCSGSAVRVTIVQKLGKDLKYSKRANP